MKLYYPLILQTAVFSRTVSDVASHFLVTYQDNTATSMDSLDYWPRANVYQAMFDHYERTGLRDTILDQYLSKLSKFDYKGDSNQYLDDRAWLALAALKAHDLNPTQEYIDHAAHEHQLMQQSWSEKCGGGVLWTINGNYKNTIANGLYFELSSKLYLKTNNQFYLNEAKKVISWIMNVAKLYDGKVFQDGITNIDSSCNINGGVYSYQHGVIISGMVNMFKATSDKNWLDQATQMALNSISSFSTNNVIHEYGGCDLAGTSNDCGNDGSLFKGIYVRGLARLLEVAGVNSQNSAIANLLANSWNSLVNTDLFSSNPQNLVAGLNWAGNSQRRDAKAQVIALDLLNSQYVASPQQTLACVYWDANFGGRQICYTSTGYYDAPWNDEISSLAVLASNCKVTLAENGRLGGRTRTFGYGSVSYVGLLLTEDLTSTWVPPTADEYEDVFKTIQLGAGRVARSYTLGFGPTYHVTGIQQYYEPAWVSFDRMLATARNNGIRVIVPIINNNWPNTFGGYEYFCEMVGKDPSVFFTDMEIRNQLKAVIRFMLNRRNTINGIRYGDDKTILAWELGNELNQFGIVPAEWTLDIAGLIKYYAPKTLVMTGSFGTFDPNNVPNLTTVLSSHNIDILTNHYYDGFEGYLPRDIAVAQTYNKAFIAGEVGFSFDTISYVWNSMLGNSNISGALVWSLRYHSRLGGFYTHSEGNGIFSFHAPGFQAKNGFSADDYRIAQYIRSVGLQLQDLPDVDAIPPPSKHVENALTSTLDLRWFGSAWAANYEISRYEKKGDPKKVVAYVNDGVDHGNPIFKDYTTDPSKSYYYEIVPISIRNSPNRVSPLVIGPIPGAQLPNDTFVYGNIPFTSDDNGGFYISDPFATSNGCYWTTAQPYSSVVEQDTQCGGTCEQSQNCTSWTFQYTNIPQGNCFLFNKPINQMSIVGAQQFWNCG
ncbi:hypothetical protein HDV06_000656 [Boothiomyces sp. JEL0866]|nr:hypothetical protein HDV06_000656 [Boothiomyces sp. JEL0866]